MKKVFFISLILLFVLNIKSQPLSRFYNNINGNEFGSNVVIKDENRYLITTFGICDPGTGNSKKCRTFLALNSKDEIVKVRKFINWFKFAESVNLQITNDTIYAFGINEEIWGEKTSWNIYKTNFRGDSLDFFTYEEFDDVVVFPVAMQIKGDYIYLLGRHYNWWTYRQDYIVIVKIDKHGKKIKEIKYGEGHKVLNMAFSMIKTIDGDFMVSGWIINSDYKEFIRPFIVKFDENLNLLEEKKLGTYWQSGINFPYLTGLLDRGVVVTNGFYVPDRIDELGVEYKKYELYPATIHKFDKGGNPIWSDTLWTLIERGTVGARKRIKKLITAKNGDVIGCGYYRDVDQKRWGYLIRINSTDGDIKWEKKYEESRYPNAKSIFWDVKEAENGDIVVTGEMDSNEGWGGDDSYTWLLRVDSMGCFEPGCEKIDTVQLIYTESDYISGTSEVISDYSYGEGIVVYPNPATSLIYVDFNVIDNRTLPMSLRSAFRRIRGARRYGPMQGCFRL